MSIRLEDEYPGRSQPASASYPDGAFKNESTTGADDGTPLEIAWANDKEAFFQKLRAAAGVEANNDVDTVVANQNWYALLRALSNTAPPQATPAQISGEQFNVNIADPAVYPNYVDTGETIKDACIGFDQDLGRPILIVLWGDTDLKKYSWPWAYTGTPIPSTLSPTWGTTPDDIVAICSDAEFLYVMWRETSANVHISKFALDPWTGTELEVRDLGYNAFPTTGNPAGALCVADNDNIGVLIHQDEGGGDHRIRMGVWAKDDSSWQSSSFSAYDADFYCAKIISDGTYLYTLGRDESGSPTYVYALLRINIATPATQNIGTFPSTTSSNYQEWMTSLCRVRDLVVVSNMQGDLWGNKKGETGSVILFQALPFVYKDATHAYGTMMVSDGQNLHAHYLQDESQLQTVFKMPAAEFHKLSTSLSTKDDVALSRTRIDVETDPPLVHIFGRMLFDGRDVWVVCYNGKIFRLANPAGG